jgi:hypothetical protein
LGATHELLVLVLVLVLVVVLVVGRAVVGGRVPRVGVT